MRIQFLKNLGLFGNKGDFTTCTVEEAEFYIKHGIARAVDSQTNLAILHGPTSPESRSAASPAVPRSPGSFGDFVRAVVRNDSYYLEKHYASRLVVPDPLPHEKAALAESSGVTGGYTVPIAFNRRIMASVAERSVIRPLALLAPMASRELQFPLLDVSTAQAAGVSPMVGGLQLRWTTEGNTRTETEPQFK
jgi:HK97 family phage major capsid protein